MFFPELAKFTKKKEQKANWIVSPRKRTERTIDPPDKIGIFTFLFLTITHVHCTLHMAFQRLTWCVFFHARFRAHRGFAYILPVLYTFIVKQPRNIFHASCFRNKARVAKKKKWRGVGWLSRPWDATRKVKTHLANCCNFRFRKQARLLPHEA